MKLEKNEYTTEQFISLLRKKFGNKLSGADFTSSDIAQYIRRGQVPHRYGGQKLKASKVSGVRIITLVNKIK